MDSQFIKILREEMNKYAIEGINSKTYLTENSLQNIYTSTTISKDDNNANPFFDLFVRIVADTIIMKKGAIVSLW